MESAMLNEYLATHDAECPACGYNVRGMRGDNCPECGRRLELGIREAGFGPRRGLLLLIFGLLLATGAARGVLASRAVYDAGWRQPQVMFTYNFSASGSGLQGGGAAGATITPMPRTRIVGPQGVNPSWDATLVSGLQWAAAGWWVLLGVAALGALVLVATARRQTVSRRRQSVITTVAWVGGLGGAVALFAEMLGAL